MIETVATYNTFWLIIFSAITIIAVGGILGIVVIKLKNKDTDIFFKSSDNAKEVTLDTTDKMSTVAKTTFTVAHEQEMHHLEALIKEISFKLDALTERVIYLEKNKD